MKNIYSLFFILVFFLILIKELLPVFIILVVVGFIVFIITSIINQKKSEELEKQQKLQEQVKLERKARQEKIQRIQEKCSKFTPVVNGDTLAKQEQALKFAQSLTSRSIYDRPFIDVIVKRNQIKYDIYKCAMSCIDAIRQDTFNDDMTFELDRLIAEYDKCKFSNDNFFVSDIQKAEFKKLKSLFEDVRNKCFTLLSHKSYSSTLNFRSGHPKVYNFNHECFLNVKSSEEVIHLDCHNVSLYIYPLFIVESGSNDNFTIHPWRDLTFDIRKIRAYTKGYGSELKGAVELSHSYEHTCIDGTPDMRYKKNDIYRTYNVCVLSCKQISGFNFVIANETLANNLTQCFNQYAILIESKDRINVRNLDNLDNDDVSYPLFFNELDNIISKYGVEIISTKRLYFIMSDLGCFENDSKLHMLFRDLADDNILNLFLNSYITQAKVEDLALIYSYKFNYPVDDCMSIINKIKDIIRKYHVNGYTSTSIKATI